MNSSGEAELRRGAGHTWAGCRVELTPQALGALVDLVRQGIAIYIERRTSRPSLRVGALPECTAAPLRIQSGHHGVHVGVPGAAGPHPNRVSHKRSNN